MKIIVAERQLLNKILMNYDPVWRTYDHCLTYNNELFDDVDTWVEECGTVLLEPSVEHVTLLWYSDQYDPRWLSFFDEHRLPYLLVLRNAPDSKEWLFRWRRIATAVSPTFDNLYTFFTRKAYINDLSTRRVVDYLSQFLDDDKRLCDECSSRSLLRDAFVFYEAIQHMVNMVLRASVVSDNERLVVCSSTIPLHDIFIKLMERHGGRLDYIVLRGVNAESALVMQTRSIHFLFLHNIGDDPSAIDKKMLDNMFNEHAV